MGSILSGLGLSAEVSAKIDSYGSNYSDGVLEYVLDNDYNHNLYIVVDDQGVHQAINLDAPYIASQAGMQGLNSSAWEWGYPRALSEDGLAIVVPADQMSDPALPCVFFEFFATGSVHNNFFGGSI